MLPGFKVLHFQLPADWRIPRHRHDVPALVVQARGGYRAEAGRDEVESAIGELVTVPPDITHSERISPRGSEALIVGIDPRRTEDLGAVSVFERLRRFRGPRIQPLVAKVLREYRSTDVASAIGLESALLELLVAAERHRPPAADRRTKWLAEVREILEEDFESRPDLSRLARRAGVSRAHLARSFRRAFGCSIGEYVRRRRLRQATELLRSSDLPLAEVALACGFYDQSHFCRLFRESMGTTPAVWRDDVGRRGRATH